MRVEESLKRRTCDDLDNALVAAAAVEPVRVETVRIDKVPVHLLRDTRA